MKEYLCSKICIPKQVEALLYLNILYI